MDYGTYYSPFDLGPLDVTLGGAPVSPAMPTTSHLPARQRL